MPRRMQKTPKKQEKPHRAAEAAQAILY